MWPPFLSLKILGLGRQVNWLYRPACVGRLCHSKYKMAATSDILYKSTALLLKIIWKIEKNERFLAFLVFKCFSQLFSMHLELLTAKRMGYAQC